MRLCVGCLRHGGCWRRWGRWILGYMGWLDNGTTEYTKRGKAEVAKADRPQPRRGASAAANTRNTLNVGDGVK